MCVSLKSRLDIFKEKNRAAFRSESSGRFAMHHVLRQAPSLYKVHMTQTVKSAKETQEEHEVYA